MGKEGRQAEECEEGPGAPQAGFGTAVSHIPITVPPHTPSSPLLSFANYDCHVISCEFFFLNHDVFAQLSVDLQALHQIS